MRVLQLLLLLLSCSGTLRPVVGKLSAVGQEPWIIVWKKGVDADLLHKILCPTVSTGDDSKLGTAGLVGDLSTASRGLKGTNTAELVLNCSARFAHVFNGFAGHFTLKEMEAIKAQYKHSIDFVISDKTIQIDSPPAPADVGLGWDMDAPSAAAEPNRAIPAAHGRTPSMVMDVEPEGPHQHRRQLLFTPPKLVTAAAALRRMLPEEHNATWGLDILDQGVLPLDAVYNYTYNGSGVHVYVLDTGIRTTHKEFLDPSAQRTRAFHAFDAVYNSNSSEDCHGHGSHVSAIVGGNTFGVAKNVTLHAVRVLACDGTAMVSALLKGLDWVGQNHIKPAVVHMSIEGSFSSIVNSAVEQLIKVNHVHVVVSSGNNGKDACLASPASAPSAITVAAVDDHLARWQYANWGACVDLFAPGVAILSAVSNYGDSGTALKTGTSMAAPFVTGVVAAYLEKQPGASPEEVQQKLYQKAKRGSVLDDAQGFATMFPSQYPDLLDISSTPNRLLQANLTAQADLSPGKLFISNNTTEPLAISIKLTSQPSDNVTVSVVVPPAWDGTPMAAVRPAQLQFSADNWNQPKTLLLRPRPVCDGDYFLQLNLMGVPEDGFPALHTVLVTDSRVRSGENAAMARVITKLPFNDTGDSTTFSDNYRCQNADASPDVVYSYTPPVDADAAISTCGSGFDTKLLVTTNLSDPSTYMCNDDDHNCVTNKACSKLDVTFKAGTTYFIVVDGYGGASGEFALSITCNSKCPPAFDPVSADTTEAGDSDASDVADNTPSPSPSSSDLLMQALLQYSHNATSTSRNQGLGGPGVSPSPEPAGLTPQLESSPSPQPHPSPAARATPPSPAPNMHAHTPPINNAVGDPQPTPSHAVSPQPGPASASAVTAGVDAEGNAALLAGPPVQGPIATLLAGLSFPRPAAASTMPRSATVVARSLIGVVANATNVTADSKPAAAEVKPQPREPAADAALAHQGAANNGNSSSGNSMISSAGSTTAASPPAHSSTDAIAHSSNQSAATPQRVELAPHLVGIGPIHLGHIPQQGSFGSIAPSLPGVSLLGGSSLAHAGPLSSQQDLQALPATSTSGFGAITLAHAGNRDAVGQGPAGWSASTMSAQPAAAGDETGHVLTPAAASTSPAIQHAASNAHFNGQQIQPADSGDGSAKGWDCAGQDLRGVTDASREQLPLLASAGGQQ